MTSYLNEGPHDCVAVWTWPPKWLNPSPYLQVLKVQVSLVLVGGLVPAVTVGDDRVQQLLEDLVGLLVSGDAAHGHDEGVTLQKRYWRIRKTSWNHL